MAPDSSRLELSLHEVLGRLKVGPVDSTSQSTTFSRQQSQTSRTLSQVSQSSNEDTTSTARRASVPYHAQSIPKSVNEDTASTTKRVFTPYHSQSVPRSENLQAQTPAMVPQCSSATTMMLRNIPNKYTQNTLMEEIDDNLFLGTYNFFYLPMDVHNRSNVGYAFINFLDPRDAARFLHVFGEHRFQKIHSRKVSSVCPAHVQGLDENLKHFENRAVTHSRNDQYRPVVLKQGEIMDFDTAVAEAKVRLAAEGRLRPQTKGRQEGGGPARGQQRPLPPQQWPPPQHRKQEPPPPPTMLPYPARDFNTSLYGSRLGLEFAIREMLTSPQFGASQTGCETTATSHVGVLPQGVPNFGARLAPPPGLAGDAQQGPEGPAYANFPFGSTSQDLAGVTLQHDASLHYPCTWAL